MSDNAKEAAGNGSGVSPCYAVFGNKRVACTGCGWWHLCRTEEIGQRLYDDHKCGRGPFGCKCKTLSQAVTGDGCDECNPEYAARMQTDSA